MQRHLSQDHFVLHFDFINTIRFRKILQCECMGLFIQLIALWRNSLTQRIRVGDVQAADDIRIPLRNDIERCNGKILCLIAQLILRAGK